MKLTFSRPVRSLWPLVLSIMVTAVPLAAQSPMTLQQAIAIAQRDGHSAKEADATRAGAQYRDRVFNARQLPQLALTGTLPSYHQSIVPITQPDGTIQYRAQNQTSAALSATLSQSLPFSGGNVFVQTSLGRLTLSGTQNRDLWNSTPFTIGVNQNLFQPNNIAWDRKEEVVSIDIAEQRYLESREDVAIETTTLFFDAYIAGLSHKNALTNAAVNDTLFERNKQRFLLGRIGESDTIASDIQHLLSITQVEQARLDDDRAAAALRLALGLPAGVPLNLEMSLQVPAFSVDTGRAVAEAMKNGTNPLTVEQQRIESERAVSAAKLQNGIQASVTASFGFNGSADGFRGVYQQPERAEQFQLLVSMPLLQYGARGNSIRAAEADRDRAASSSSYLLAQAAQQAHFIALQLPLARSNLAIAAKADTAAARYFEMQYNLYGNGKLAIDLLYAAQAQKNQAFSSYLQALRTYWLTYYELRRLTLFDFETGQAIR